MNNNHIHFAQVVQPLQAPENQLSPVANIPPLAGPPAAPAAPARIRNPEQVNPGVRRVLLPRLDAAANHNDGDHPQAPVDPVAPPQVIGELARARARNAVASPAPSVGSSSSTLTGLITGSSEVTSASRA